MRQGIGLSVIIGLLAVSVWSQTTTTTTAPKTTATPSAVSGHPIAVIDTTAGKMTCVLFPTQAPIGVANFIGLASGTRDWTNPVTHTRKHGVPLYDGTIFHRVIPEFMIQGGDPAGTGTGDPGYKFKNETSPDLTFDRPGRLAYANAGPGTNGSQFFITEIPYPSLNGGYTIFGQCDDAAVELVKQIARMASDPRDNRPFRPVKINHITITNAGAAATPKPTAPAKKPMGPTTTAPKATTPQNQDDKVRNCP
jgi:peptidyl-prolyl cis-trans isomerase A (cyclophilin A)